MRLFLYLIIFSFFSSFLKAQDPVFSQFYATPLQVNPAFAGVTFAPRITANYRNQWSGLNNAFVTYAATYEQSLEDLNSGIGLVFQTDDAGNGIYKTSWFKAIYGYKLQLNDEFTFKFGVEAGMVQSVLDWDQLVFGDQLDPITGQQDPSGNSILSEEVQPESLNNTRVDIGAGLMVFNKNFYVGISAKHLNSPDESLLQINQNLSAGLPVRYTIHGGAEITLLKGNNRKSPTFISPNVLLIRQGDFSQINGGAYAGFGQFFGGLWYRHTFKNADAAILLAGVKQGVFRIGYSYDFTVSGLANSNPGGTHEIALSINFDDSTEAKKRRQASRYHNCFKMFN